MRTILPFLLFAIPIQAQETREVKGAVQEIDVPNGTITLLIYESGKTKVSTFNLFKADIPLQDDAGSPLKWADVPPGRRT